MRMRQDRVERISVPPTQTSIEYGNYVEYNTLSSITDSGPIEFDVSSNGQNYLDFANTQLLVKSKITRGNGDDITDADHVGGVNLFLRSLFQQVDISLNDVQVSQSTRTYSYRAYIESLLSYGPQAKTTLLTASLYYKDTAGNMNRPNLATLTRGDELRIAEMGRVYGQKRRRRHD